MFIEQRIYQLLVPGTLSALYPEQAPDATKTPYTTYHIMNYRNLTTHSAPLPATRMWRFQFNTYSESMGVARTISNNIVNTLVGYVDPYILGITTLNDQSLWVDLPKLHGWMSELLVTEQLITA